MTAYSLAVVVCRAVAAWVVVWFAGSLTSAFVSLTKLNWQLIPKGGAVEALVSSVLFFLALALPIGCALLLWFLAGPIARLMVSDLTADENLGRPADDAAPDVQRAVFAAIGIYALAMGIQPFLRGLLGIVFAGDWAAPDARTYLVAQGSLQLLVGGALLFGAGGAVRLVRAGVGWLRRASGADSAGGGTEGT